MPDRLWLPTDVTATSSPKATLEGWYFLRDATGALANGAKLTLASGKVSKWDDASGKGRHLTQPAGGVLPAYDANGFSTGVPGVVMSGANQGLSHSATPFPTGKMMNAFMALRPTAKGRAASFVSTGTQSYDYAAAGAIPIMIDTNLQYWYNFANQTVPYTLNTPALFEGYSISDTTGVANIDGGTASAAVTNDPAGKTMQIVGIMTRAHSAPGEGASGAVSEAVIFAGLLTPTDIQRIEGYIAWNNGTQSRLPTNHPYKAAAPTVSDGGSAAPPPRRRALLLN